MPEGFQSKKSKLDTDTKVRKILSFEKKNLFFMWKGMWFKYKIKKNSIQIEKKRALFVLKAIIGVNFFFASWTYYKFIIAAISYL